VRSPWPGSRVFFPVAFALAWLLCVTWIRSRAPCLFVFPFFASVPGPPGFPAARSRAAVPRRQPKSRPAWSLCSDLRGVVPVSCSPAPSSLLSPGICVACLPPDQEPQHEAKSRVLFVPLHRRHIATAIA
jgi:hypothetical protein